MNFEQRCLRQALAATLPLALVFLFSHHLFAKSTFMGCGGEQVEPTNAAYEARVAELVNEARAEKGLPPMKLSPALSQSARYHATDMQQDDYTNHNTFDRENGALVPVCNWDVRISVYYTIGGGLAENLSAGYTTPEEAMAGWLNSQSHREQILGTYREIGVGYADGYWVQDFGDRQNFSAVIINREAQKTTSPDVTLYLYGDWQQMRLRNDDGSWGAWQPFQREAAWSLANLSGERRVEVEVTDNTTQTIISDTILLETTTPTDPTPTPTATSETPTIYLPTILK